MNSKASKRPKNTQPNKEDFMWHEMPSMKSHVALNPCAWLFSMHLPALFEILSSPAGTNFWHPPSREKRFSAADKIVIQLTNQEYFDNLKRDSIPFDGHFEMMDSTYAYPKTYSVIYFLKNPNEVNYMHVINEIGGLGPAGIFVELNDKFELIEPLRFIVSSLGQLSGNTTRKRSEPANAHTGKSYA